MHDAFKTTIQNTFKEQMTQDQFVFHLVSSEWDNRRNRAIERAIKAALGHSCKHDGARFGVDSFATKKTF